MVSRHPNSQGKVATLPAHNARETGAAKRRGTTVYLAIRALDYRGPAVDV
jgi:hypothetical protein